MCTYMSRGVRNKKAGAAPRRRYRSGYLVSTGIAIVCRRPWRARSCRLFASTNIGAFGIFSNPTFHWNALVPVGTRNVSKYVAFDNTGALVTGVAVSNVAATAAAIPAVIRD